MVIDDFRTLVAKAGILVLRTCAIGALLFSVRAAADTECGDPWRESALQRPLDYTVASDREDFDFKVKRFHFTPAVEQLIRGESGPLPFDLAYSLRQSPNHHRVLRSMMEWQLKNAMPKDARERGLYSMECYFHRALMINESDSSVYLLKGIYHHRKREVDAARDAYSECLSLNPDFAEAHYNIGLLYAEMEKYDLARAHAKRAYELNYPLPGLRNKLKRLGRWE